MSKAGTARAAVFSAPNRALDLETFPLPALGAGEVLVRVTACTLCGSDLHTFQGRRSTPTPTILGHEILGEVAELGPSAAPTDLAGDPLAVGERVTWTIGASCGTCFFCEHALPQKCERLSKYGHEAIRREYVFSGGLAEYCHLLRGTGVVCVPDRVPDTVACPANCATATVAAALRTGGDCGGEAVLVQGVGMLGLSACAMARVQGAREVIAVDVDAARLKLAARFGATRQVLLGDDEAALPNAVEDATSGRGVDLALELSGAASAMAAGGDLLRIGGRYVLVGAVFPGPPFLVSPERVIRRLLSIHGLHNYTPDDLVTAVQFLAHHHDDFPFAELVQSSFPLSDVNAAFDHAIASRELRVLVRP
ncbi:MAG: alcohol dehydrogenase catalytic domain-containing protein [Nitrospiraceae bacterium]|nr:alcohol dehydrogenase catalytic domain-containing protein [Nitrospiraceae bacterium]